VPTIEKFKTMKTIFLIALMIGMTSISFGQTTTSETAAPAAIEKKDGEKRDLYKLPREMEYEVFNAEGARVETGTGTAIDYTDYAPGVYYIVYVGETMRFVVEEKKALE